MAGNTPWRVADRLAGMVIIAGCGWRAFPGAEPQQDALRVVTAHQARLPATKIRQLLRPAACRTGQADHAPRQAACVWKQLLAAQSEISVAVDLRSMTDNHADDTDLRSDRELPPATLARKPA
jgi:hypothetical protein